MVSPELNINPLLSTEAYWRSLELRNYCEKSIMYNAAINTLEHEGSFEFLFDGDGLLLEFIC